MESIQLTKSQESDLKTERSDTANKSGLQFSSCEAKTVSTNWMQVVHLANKSPRRDGHRSLQGCGAWRYKSGHTINSEPPPLQMLYFSLRYERGDGRGNWTEVNGRIKQGNFDRVIHFLWLFYGAFLKGGSERNQGCHLYPFLIRIKSDFISILCKVTEREKKWEKMCDKILQYWKAGPYLTFS